MINKHRDNYTAWEIDEKDFPRNGSMEDRIEFLIGYGILAPSTHNTQPWKFEVKNNILYIRVRQDRLLPAGDPLAWGLFISIGACVENIIQAANFFGMQTTSRFVNSRLITIEFKDNPGGKVATAMTKQLQNIRRRHSHKLKFAGSTLPNNILKRVQKRRSEQTSITVVHDDRLRDAIIDIHLRSASRIASNKKFAVELSRWLRNNGTRKHDGMPGFVVGNSGFISLLGKIVLRVQPKVLSKISAKDKHLLSSASAFVIFSVKTPRITPEVMFQVGRDVEDWWLYITELGLVAHPMFATIQDESGSKDLAEAVHINERPVFFMRLGYSKNKHYHTPRELH